MPVIQIGSENSSFSRHCMQDIENGIISKGTRTEIIHTLGTMMWNHVQSPSSFEYTEICHKLITKHPILKDAIGNRLV